MTAKTSRGDIGDMQRAKALRLAANLALPMSERLARVHTLSKQMTAIKGAARARSAAAKVG